MVKRTTGHLRKVCARLCVCVCVHVHVCMHRVMVIVVWLCSRLYYSPETIAQDGQGRTSQEGGEGPGTSGGGGDAGSGRSPLWPMRGLE